MELIPINPKKLKIILSSEDMTALDITNADLDYASDKTKRALGCILEKARTETGFDAKDDKLFVEVFPSVDGGCEMFLTRKDKSADDDIIKSKHSYKRKYGKNAILPSSCEKYIAVSENIEDIISLCLRLKNENFNGVSSLFEKDGKYFLMIGFVCGYPCFSKKEHEEKNFSFMCDYCNITKENPVDSAYLDEHGKIIIKKNAVETIWKNFGENLHEQHGF